MTFEEALKIAKENMINEPHFCSEDENAFFFSPAEYCLTAPFVVLKETGEIIVMDKYLERYDNACEFEILNKYNF